eukprot:731541-Pelagomonas_calceolata.AAC.1
MRRCRGKVPVCSSSGWLVANKSKTSHVSTLEVSLPLLFFHSIAVSHTAAATTTASAMRMHAKRERQIYREEGGKKHKPPTRQQSSPTNLSPLTTSSNFCASDRHEEELHGPFFQIKRMGKFGREYKDRKDVEQHLSPLALCWGSSRQAWRGQKSPPQAHCAAAWPPHTQLLQPGGHHACCGP